MDTSNQLASLGIQASVRGVGWDTAYTDALSQPLMWGWGPTRRWQLYNIYHTDEALGTAQYSRTPTRRWTPTWSRPWKAQTWRSL